jgi:hypothetical protein
MRVRTHWVLVASTWVGACADDGSPPLGDVGTTEVATTEDTAATTAAPPDVPARQPVTDPWAPGTVLPSIGGSNRGLLDLRGLIHTHSPYSHDACDGNPRDESDNIDAICFEDLRRALCQTRHDYVMLTDHRESFARTGYPEVLLYDPPRGDVLVERNGSPVASWAGCTEVDPVLILAGTESATMPVGLERHVAGGGDSYGAFTVDALAEFKAEGAVALVAHTEGWTVEELSLMPLDGFEMYNLHANLFYRLAEAAALVSMVQQGSDGLPHPDLSLFPIWAEDPAYLTRWGSVLASGVRRVTTLGTDAHRNTLPQLLADGERIDSFRRMMVWFSNHLLVRPDDSGQWDDRNLKDALREGRLYGAFEYLGYPGGFDAMVETEDGVFEIGAEVPLSAAPEIVAHAPVVRDLDFGAEAPVVTVHLMRALEDGFEEVADASDELRYDPQTAGAYRVEVRIAPRHLRAWLGDFAAEADTPRVWIYANPFYIRDGS